MTRTVVLAPWRPGAPEREQLWAFTRAWWRDRFPGFEIFTGAGPHVGSFNRSAAINEAAAAAGDGWDVAIIIDTDTIPEARNVAAAVHAASSTGQMVVAHTRRHMLSRSGTAKVLNGHQGSWCGRPMVQKVFHDSVSCCVAVSRELWDRVGGFDPLFVGWGREDTAFRIACETVTDRPIICLDGESWHLWHPESTEARNSSPVRKRNEDRHRRYVDARWDPAMLQDLLDEATAWTPPAEAPSVAPAPAASPASGRIPRLIFRTVPADTTDEVEGFWARFAELHPGWELRTYREPLDPADWPLSGHLFDRCANGAQKAGLVRLEGLVRHGGVYVDSDVEPHRNLEPLLWSPAFAAWEDETTVPDAVLGAEPGHPAFVAMLEKAIACVEGGGDAWHSGPGVVTETLPGRPDVLLLPPGSFYPHHYLEKAKAGIGAAQPWAFVEHRWHHSWGTPAQRRSISQRQRP